MKLPNTSITKVVCTFEQNFAALKTSGFDLFQNRVQGVRRVPELDEPNVAAVLLLDDPLEDYAVQRAENISGEWNDLKCFGLTK